MNILTSFEEENDFRSKKWSKQLIYIIIAISFIIVSIMSFLIFNRKFKNNQSTPISHPNKYNNISSKIKLASYSYISGLSTEQKNNAKYIKNFFTQKGWTLESICGMLGNIQVESGIKPDIHEIGGGSGYGLTQWTPDTKLKNWANENHLNYRLIRTQCERIQYECDSELQWGTKFVEVKMTFKQFTKSKATPTYLAKVFIYNYEKPQILDQPKRGKIAEEWYRYFLNGEIDPEPSKKSGKWLNSVNGANTNDPNNGYAGIFGVPIDSITVDGNYRYRVHVLGGDWLPEVNGFDIQNDKNGFAGIYGKKIDGFMINGRRYRCHTTNGIWYPDVNGYNTQDKNNGYAGSFGHPIDAIIVYGAKYRVHVIY